MGSEVPLAMVGGVRVHCFESSEQLLRFSEGRHAILIAVNAEKVVNADADLRALINRQLGYVDGVGVALALRRQGIRTARIAGADLWQQMVASWAGRRSFCLVGASPAVVQATADRLLATHPTLVVTSHRHGYLGPAEVADLKRDLAVERPDVVLVATGSPRQERLMADLLEAWPALYLGLGGSFDVYAGARRRAPGWMRRIGLEWAFRFVADPRRLGRLPAIARFGWMLLRGRL